MPLGGAADGQKPHQCVGGAQRGVGGVDVLPPVGVGERLKQHVIHQHLLKPKLPFGVVFGKGPGGAGVDVRRIGAVPEQLPGGGRLGLHAGMPQRQHPHQLLLDGKGPGRVGRGRLLRRKRRRGPPPRLHLGLGAVWLLRVGGPQRKAQPHQPHRQRQGAVLQFAQAAVPDVALLLDLRRGQRPFPGRRFGKHAAQRDGLLPGKQQLQRGLAAVGAGPLRLKGVAQSPGILAAHLRQGLLAAFPLQGAVAVLPLDGTPPQPVAGELGVPLRRCVGQHMQRPVHLVAQLGRAVHAK